jgi:3-deoxy-manno-octulosonate cytidylyltransferase (CMP-KDO synthetase)
MKFLGIIPARYASTRFPGKPLAVIQGKSMIRRVYEQAGACPSLEKVIVATDHRSIEEHVRSFGGNVLMTSSKHQSGTERCWEVAGKLKEAGENYDVIVNIQGDEPFIDSRQISQICECFKEDDVKIATLGKKIKEIREIDDPNVVKVVTGLNLRALYFSRSPIPFRRSKVMTEWTQTGSYFKHIGIYGYRIEILQELVLLKTTPLEQAESLEQLRWLEHGYHITVRETEFDSVSIDTPADLLKITNRD